MKLLGSIVAVANCQLPARSQAQQASVSVAAPPVAAPRTIGRVYKSGESEKRIF